MLEQIVLAASVALVGLLLYYLPVMKGPDAFFGIPVSEEFYRGPIARRNLRAYWLVTAAMEAGAITFLLGAPALGMATVGPMLAAMLTAFLGPLVPMVIIWRRLRPHELHMEAAQPAAEEQPTNPWRYVSPWVEALQAGAFLLLAGLVLWRYPALPERIPIHWNAAGQADGWTAKSPLPLLSLVLLLGCGQVLFLGLLIGLARLRVRLPAERAEEYREARERYMRVSVEGVNLLRFGLVPIFGGILWASLFGLERQAAGGAPPGMALVWVGTAVTLLGVGWLIIKGLHVRKEMREIAGPGWLEVAAPTTGWIGGMVYYNPNDPALWVEKRVGIGWTLNFARPAAWVITGLVVVLPLGIAFLGLAGAGRW